ncbi:MULTISPECIES: LytR/AlgR family response regulator transcription factor [Maribacter]|uniref:Response regulator transcription factor n=2 Tax=Maribacter TaxID=252356 RepID=A0A5R8M7U7_9FLAO|nr:MULTISPECIES: LytTR family DNA-binding domain-containing protein [Maribacter]MDC6404948.1 LytTR family DNA-binding domain-containing protein [Maribacter sp. PR66]MEE1972362.1 LytTR family DNA-binding domain-containing protein [Maribacter flavus]TLF45575.1 response regulator transcription factor [Maribacter aurantiacus]
MKKVLIADDEKAGRQLIKEYLEGFPDLILISEVNNGVDAVKEINEFKPDLVFLDVQMPGFTGFEVLTRLEEIPNIIFSTAYDKYALQAFEVHAIDYLLKPYTKERFTKAIEKLNQTTEKVGSLTQSLLMDKTDYPERVLVEKKDKLITIAVADIIWIEAYGDYSKLHTASDVLVSNYGISALEEKLNPKSFLRVHRSSLINLNKVKELHKYGKSYDITMENNEVVRVSRGYMDAIKKIML